MSTDLLHSFASRLRSERQRLGLTQLELAAELGLQPATYRSYEAGRTLPQINVLQGLDALGADIHWLATGRTLLAAAALSTDWSEVLECTRVINEWAIENPSLASKDVMASYLRVAFTMLAAGNPGNAVASIRSILPKAA